MLYDNICRIAKSKKISINKLEQELGISRGSICKWNEIEPGIRKVQKVADRLGVKIEVLLSE